MRIMMPKSFMELKEQAQELNQDYCPRVGVVCPEGKITFDAIDQIAMWGLAEPVLIGDCQLMRDESVKYGFPFGQYETVDRLNAEESCKAAVEKVASGEIDFLLKGNVQTKDILGAAVGSATGLRTGGLMSHVTIVELPGRKCLTALTDAGMNINPTKEERIKIIRNAIAVMHALGMDEPKVAMLAAVGYVHPKMPITQEEWDIANNEHFEGAIVEGPFAIDGALRPKAAETKHDGRIVAGQADILVVPEIVAGNLLTKGWEEVGVPWGGVVTGGKVPLAVSSQGDMTSEIRVNSVAIATILFHRQSNKAVMPS